MNARQPSRRSRERYEFAASPWVQNLTQRELASLLRLKRSQLKVLATFKEAWIIRRTATIGRKERDLVYPYGKLRTVHERLKYLLGKIKQPEYLYSPRGGRAQRDNAALHVGQNQFLTLDICQFYPSTTSEHVFRWAYHEAGLLSDVAGLFTKLATVDEKLSFGSPLSPILATLVHRAMFDEIFELCRSRGLRMSLWVDDLTISGRFIPGDLLSEIRAILARAGLRSHKIRYRSGARPVTITGVPVCRSGVIAPRALHQRIQDGFTLLHTAASDVERNSAIDLLLGQLGSLRYHMGKDSVVGRRAADRMNTLRRDRKRLVVTFTTEITRPSPPAIAAASTDAPPWC